jgi:hypothetical protein
MNRWLRTLVRPTALVAAVLYAFAPAVVLASCNCGDCACAVAEESGGACCCVQAGHGRHAHERAACCTERSVKHCDSCAAPATSEVQGCSCDSELTSQPVSEQPKQTHDSGRISAAAGPISLGHLAAFPASDSLSSLEVAQASIASPPPRILFCVWRN